MELSHLDDRGAARMVDVGQKPVSLRTASATAQVRMASPTLRLIRDGGLPKGDVLALARAAGIMAAKRTSELIPLCHLLPLDSVAVDFAFPDENSLAIHAAVRVQARTGVEMEALTAVSIAALTIYDMCKAVDRDITIDNIRLESKTGGRSGDYLRPAAPPDRPTA